MSANQERRERDHLAAGEGTVLSSLSEWGGARPLLIGNDIENPGNADSLRVAAEMFDWECGFLYDSHHSGAQPAAGLAGSRIISTAELAACGMPIIALENASGAEDLFRFRPPEGRFVVVAGNERKGISHDILRLADRVVQIPIASAHINTVNVAAAAAIALYYLSRGGGGRAVPRGGHERGRPEVLLAAPTDAIEVGSVVRSAACFGWTRLFVDDRHDAWFDTDRVTRSLGRGAARRGRNPIRVLPARGCGLFEEVCVVSTRGDGEPLRRAHLALGPGQLVVIPDESGGAIEDREFARLGRHVRRVRLETEHAEPRPFRLVASIALAEIARQVGGWRRPSEGKRGQRNPLSVFTEGGES